MEDQDAFLASLGVHAQHADQVEKDVIDQVIHDVACHPQEHAGHLPASRGWDACGGVRKCYLEELKLNRLILCARTCLLQALAAQQPEGHEDGAAGMCRLADLVLQSPGSSQLGNSSFIDIGCKDTCEIQLHATI